MLEHLVQRAGKSIPITPLSEKRLPAWLKEQPAEVQNWVRANSFTAKPATVLLLNDRHGHARRVLVGVEEGIDRWSLGALPGTLAQGTYQLDDDLSAAEATAHAFAWAMGCYRFGRYKSEGKEFAKLVWPQGCDIAAVERAAAATTLARDLITTPASHMGPAELAAAAAAVAKAHRAKIRMVVGDDLLKRQRAGINNFRAGRAQGQQVVGHDRPRVEAGLALLQQALAADGDQVGGPGARADEVDGHVVTDHWVIGYCGRQPVWPPSGSPR